MAHYLLQDMDKMNEKEKPFPPRVANRPSPTG